MTSANSSYTWPLHTILHTNFIMLQIMLIMLNYAVYANLCLRDAQIMLNALNYANYALCSDSAIMPKSNAGIIGPPQAEILTIPVRYGTWAAGEKLAALSHCKHSGLRTRTSQSTSRGETPSQLTGGSMLPPPESSVTYTY